MLRNVFSCLVYVQYYAVQIPWRNICKLEWSWGTREASRPRRTVGLRNSVAISISSASIVSGVRELISLLFFYKGNVQLLLASLIERGVEHLAESMPSSHFMMMASRTLQVMRPMAGNSWKVTEQVRHITEYN
jgi:hypothetical protein